MGWKQVAFSWKSGEQLLDFQRRIEQEAPKRRKLPYETQRFNEGWVWVSWSTYNPPFSKQFTPKTGLARTIYSALESGDRRFTFDNSVTVLTPEQLKEGVSEICRQLNQRLWEFLGANYRDHPSTVLLDLRYPSSENTDWVHKDPHYAHRVSWFLKRPEKQ